MAYAKNTLKTRLRTKTGTVNIASSTVGILSRAGLVTRVKGVAIPLKGRWADIVDAVKSVDSVGASLIE